VKLRKFDGVMPKIGDYVLPKSIMKDGIVDSPRQVVGISPVSVLTLDPRDPEPRKLARLYVESIAYVSPTFRIAERAWRRSSVLRLHISQARAAAISDIEAIEGER